MAAERTGERGGTLVELAVALGLAGVVVTAVALAARAAARVERQTLRTAAVQQEVAAALRRVAAAAREAGSCFGLAGLPPGTTPVTVSGDGASLTAYVPRWQGTDTLRCSSPYVEPVTYRVSGGQLLEERGGATISLTPAERAVTALTVYYQPSPAAVRVCVDVAAFSLPGGAGGGGQPPSWRACTGARLRGNW